MPRITGPNGQRIDFPEGTSDADIAAAFGSAAPSSRPAGLPEGVDLPALPTTRPSVNMRPPILGGLATIPARIQSAADKVNDYGDDLAKGVGKGFAQTIAGVTSLAPGQSDLVDILNQKAQTHNTTQAVGKGLEQAGEFLVPGAAEEKIGLKAAELAPKLRYVRPMAKIAAQAASSGTINKLQGGDFTTGAVVGGLGGAVGEGARAIAPAWAETALGARASDRAFGRTPGQAILDETTGFRPKTIATQAAEKMTGYTNDLENNAIGKTLNLSPARQVAGDALLSAEQRNEPATIRQVKQLNDQLHTYGGSSNAMIPPTVSATDGLQLKRGIGDLKTSWNPATATDFSKSAVGKTYHALDSTLDAAIPDGANLNNRISSLIPVAERASASDLNAGILQRSIGRLAKPTGATLGAVAGAGAGYKTDGVHGAVIGGIGGLIAPEFLANPTTLMLEARGLYSPALRNGLLPAAKGLGLQLDRNAIQPPKRKGLYD